MKTLLGVVLALGLSVGAYAACVGPYCYDSNTSGSMTGVVSSQSHPVVISSTTIAGLTAGSAGVLVICNDCDGNGSTSNYEVCIATAANATSWVFLSTTTKACN